MSKFLIFLAVQARISLALIGFARGSLYKAFISQQSFDLEREMVSA